MDSEELHNDVAEFTATLLRKYGHEPHVATAMIAKAQCMLWGIFGAEHAPLVMRKLNDEWVKAMRDSHRVQH